MKASLVCAQITLVNPPPNDTRKLAQRKSNLPRSGLCFLLTLPPWIASQKARWQSLSLSERTNGVRVSASQATSCHPSSPRSTVPPSQRQYSIRPRAYQQLNLQVETDFAVLDCSLQYLLISHRGSSPHSPTPIYMQYPLHLLFYRLLCASYSPFFWLPTRSLSASLSFTE